VAEDGRQHVPIAPPYLSTVG